ERRLHQGSAVLLELDQEAADVEAIPLGERLHRAPHLPLEPAQLLARQALRRALAPLVALAVVVRQHLAGAERRRRDRHQRREREPDGEPTAELHRPGLTGWPARRRRRTGTGRRTAGGRWRRRVGKECRTGGSPVRAEEKAERSSRCGTSTEHTT